MTTRARPHSPSSGGDSTPATRGDSTSVTARGIIAAAGAATLLFAVLDVALTGRVGLVFDMGFVIVCVTAALGFRPTDLYPAAVMPPLLFAATVGSVAVVAPATLVGQADGFGQGFMGGLAHNAGWLAAGYAGSLLTLAGRVASSAD
jgi:hypothetical protein